MMSMLQEQFEIAVYKGESRMNSTLVASPRVGGSYPSAAEVQDAIRANEGDWAQVNKIHVFTEIKIK